MIRKKKNIFAEKDFVNMSDLLASYENTLISKLKAGDKSAFTTIFTCYYRDLVRFSYTFTRNPDSSEELVQEVFLRLWENRDSLEIQSSLKSFLLKSVQNRSIDCLRHLNIKNKFALRVLEHPLLSENDTENYMLHSELETKLKLAMEKIPETYARVFKLSRFESLSYREIAQQLGLTERVVKDRISKTLSILREELKDFLVFALISLLFYG